MIVTVTKDWHKTSLAEVTTTMYKMYFWKVIYPPTVCSTSNWCCNCSGVTSWSVQRQLAQPEKDFFPVASKEDMEFFPKLSPSQGRKAWILFRKPIYIHIGKHLQRGHIPDQAQFKGHISEHAQFKTKVQQGETAHFRASLQDHWAYVQKVIILDINTSLHAQFRVIKRAAVKFLSMLCLIW